MFHIVLAIASRFLYFGNALQGFALGILALRNLGAISSYLIPALPPPPPIALLGASVPSAGLPEEIFPPYPSGGIVAVERIERQPPPFASPIPSYQSSLITVSSSQLPIFLPLFIIMLAIISGFAVLLPGFMNVAKSRNILKFVRSNRFSPLLPPGVLLLWAIGLPAIASVFVFIWVFSIILFPEQGSSIIVTILQRCGLLAVQGTQTPPLLDAIYEQVTRSAAGYDDLVDYAEDQVTTDGSLRYPDLAHDEIPENYRLRLQSIYTQFANSHDCLREQMEISRVYQRELHTDLLAAERERERLVSTLGESDKKRQTVKARCAEAEVIVSKLRADLTAARDHLDRQMEVASSKDHIIQSVTEKSQVAHVKLKYAEDKITHLNAKLQRERDRRLRKTKELLDEQVRVQDRHESEIQHLKQEAQDAQEQLDTLRGATSQLHGDGRSLLDQDHSASSRQPTTQCQPPLPPERIHDTGTPPICPATNDSSHLSTKSPPHSLSQGQEDPSTHRGPISITQDHRVALEKLFKRMRQGEYENTQDAAKPISERQESRLQDELAVMKEKLCLAEEKALTACRDLDQSKEALREVKTHVAILQSEWDICTAMLREAQDTQRSTMDNLAEVIELLRVSQAESEEEKFKCSQVTLLCVALQERVAELEAKVQKLRTGTQRYPVLKNERRNLCHIDSACRSCPTGAGTGCEHIPVPPSSVDSTTHELKVMCMESCMIQDSIHMTVPPLLPRIIDFSLPPSPSLTEVSQEKSRMWGSSGFSPLSLSHQMTSPTRTDIHSHTFSPADTDVHPITCNSNGGMSRYCDSHLRDLSLALQSCELARSAVTYDSANDPEFTNMGHLVPPSSPSLEGVSCLLSPVYRSFLSERNSPRPMDWPPIGPVLSPRRGNVRQDREEDIETEEGTDDPILCDQDPVLPSQESPPVPNRGRENVTYPLRQDHCTVTNASPIPSSHRNVPIRPPHHPLVTGSSKQIKRDGRQLIGGDWPPPSSSSPKPRFRGLLDPVTIDSVADGTVQPRKGHRRPSHRRSLSYDIPIPRLEYDLPSDFIPSSFTSTVPKRPVAGMGDSEFAYLIPLDCLTSTPAAARKRTLKEGLLSSGGGGTDLAGINPGRKRMPLRTINNFPRRSRESLEPFS